jgi:undecaprenyl-diphosphatase
MRVRRPIHPPTVTLALCATSFICAYLSVKYLTRYFETRTLTPFAIYCVVAGGASLAWLLLR